MVTSWTALEATVQVRPQIDLLVVLHVRGKRIFSNAVRGLKKRRCLEMKELGETKSMCQWH